MIFLTHPQEATETNDCKHDVIGQLVENDILDVSDLVATRVLHARANDCLRANRIGTCSTYSHNMTSRVVVELTERNESAGAMFRCEKSQRRPLTAGCAVG